MRAATVVQVLQDLFYVVLQVLVVAAIILSFIASFIACFILLVIAPLRAIIDAVVADVAHSARTQVMLPSTVTTCNNARHIVVIWRLLGKL